MNSVDAEAPALIAWMEAHTQRREALIVDYYAANSGSQDTPYGQIKARNHAVVMAAGDPEIARLRDSWLRLRFGVPAPVD